MGIDALAHVSLYYICNRSVSGAGNITYKAAEPDWVCLDSLFSDMSEQGIFFDPTLVDGTAALLPNAQRIRFQAAFPSVDLEQQYHWHSEIVRMAVGRGVAIVAGRDDFDWSFVYELEAYEAIGVPNAEILRMATKHPSDYIGTSDKLGTVEQGKIADLIILEGDPLERISALNNLVGVLRGGEIIVNRLGGQR